MILENTSVHDHPQTCLLSLLSSRKIDYTLLHPDSLGPNLNGLFNDWQDSVRPSEDVDDFDPDRFRNVCQFCVRRFSQNGGVFRVDWNDTIALTLHILGHRVARSSRICGKAHHCNRLGLFQNSDNIEIFHACSPESGGSMAETSLVSVAKMIDHSLLH